jgi:DNA-binding helix-turn-helix protein
MENAIRTLRMSTGLSQARFGEIYHIPKQTIKAWEYGQRKPPKYLVELLAFRVRYDLTIYNNDNA